MATETPASPDGRSDPLDRSRPLDNLLENTRKLLSKGHNKNDGELDELKNKGKNRDLIHDSMMARTPVSSGTQRFSVGGGS